jgi:hypothetical protein
VANKRDWVIWWQRKYMTPEHGHVSESTKHRAIENAKKHDLPREHAAVTHPRTHLTVFECGNAQCYSLPPEPHPDDKAAPHA